MGKPSKDYAVPLWEKTKKHFFSPIIIDAANVQQVEYTQVNDILDLPKTDFNKRVSNLILINLSPFWRVEFDHHYLFHYLCSYLFAFFALY